MSDGHRSSQLGLLVESVRAAADEAASAGMTVLLEALNPVESPRYLLPDTRTALAVLERVDRPNVRLQLDLYHVVMGGEDPFVAIAIAGPCIGHVQLADVPGRHEPGTGEIPFAALLDAIEDAGYPGPYGLEFFPLDGTAPDLGFLPGLAASG